MIPLIIEVAEINHNKQLATGIWQMSMFAPQVSALYLGPGQFINLITNDNWEHPLRRPMSIAAVKGEQIEIIYKIFGDVTKQCSRKKRGDTLNILGPLGNFFTDWKDRKENAILIGGGVGLAPILNLYNSCPAATLIIGARSGSEHFLVHKPQNKVFLTSDDGSVGISGNVLAALRELEINHNTMLFACGPEPMLKAVQKFAIQNNVRAQISVESYMGCGVGLCQGCVILRSAGPNAKHTYHEKYSLVCLDGPVYTSDEIIID